MIRDGTHSIPTICSKNEILQGGKEHILTDPGKDLKLIWKSFYFFYFLSLLLELEMFTYYKWIDCICILLGLILYL